MDRNPPATLFSPVVSPAVITTLPPAPELPVPDVTVMSPPRPLVAMPVAMFTKPELPTVVVPVLKLM